jgi:tetratricopeptide (TPR) repeat protein
MPFFLPTNQPYLPSNQERYFLHFFLYFRSMNLVRKTLSLFLISSICWMTSCTEETNPLPENDEGSFELTFDNSSTLDELNQAIIASPESPNVYLKRALYYKSIFDFENSLDDINRALKLAQDAAALHYAKADILFIAGGVRQDATFYEQAEIYLDETTRLDSTYLDAYILLARLNLGKPNHDKAMSNVQNALKINEQFAPAYFWKAMIYQDLGNFDLAKANYQTCIERDANYYDAYNHLGILLHAEGNKKALIYFDKALELRPNSIEVLRNKGLALKDENRYDEAIECFSTILTIEPAFAESYYNIGVVYITAYRDDMPQYSKDTTINQALNYFQKAVATDPQYPDALYNIGHLYKFTGDKKKAKEYFMQVLTIYPQHELTIEALNTP